MTSSTSKAGLPESLRWLFPEIDLEALDTERDADQILVRVLERAGCRTYVAVWQPISD